MTSDAGPYRVVLSERAQAALQKLDRQTAERIVKKLVWLAENAESVAHGALTGRLAGYYRRRVGSFRVIYLLDHETRLIDVALIGHRRDVYDQ